MSQVKSAYADLQHRVTSLREQREMEEPTIKQMQQQRKDLHKQLHGLKKTQAALQDQVDALKRQRENLTDQLVCEMQLTIKMSIFRMIRLLLSMKRKINEPRLMPYKRALFIAQKS